MQRSLLSIHLPLYPNLKVSLHSDFAPELVHSLLVGKLDMALVANPGPNRKLTTSKVSEAPLYVILPDNSPIAWRKRNSNFLKSQANWSQSCQYMRTMSTARKSWCDSQMAHNSRLQSG